MPIKTLAWFTFLVAVMTAVTASLGARSVNLAFQTEIQLDKNQDAVLDTLNGLETMIKRIRNEVVTLRPPLKAPAQRKSTNSVTLISDVNARINRKDTSIRNTERDAKRQADEKKEKQNGKVKEEEKDKGKEENKDKFNEKEKSQEGDKMDDQKEEIKQGNKGDKEGNKEDAKEENKEVTKEEPKESNKYNQTNKNDLSSSSMEEKIKEDGDKEEENKEENKMDAPFDENEKKQPFTNFISKAMTFFIFKKHSTIELYAHVASTMLVGKSNREQYGLQVLGRGFVSFLDDVLEHVERNSGSALYSELAKIHESFVNRRRKYDKELVDMLDFVDARYTVRAARSAKRCLAMMRNDTAPIKNVLRFAALYLIGGPMDAMSEDERRYIRDIIERQYNKTLKNTIGIGELHPPSRRLGRKVIRRDEIEQYTPKSQRYSTAPFHRRNAGDYSTRPSVIDSDISIDLEDLKMQNLDKILVDPDDHSPIDSVERLLISKEIKALVPERGVDGNDMSDSEIPITPKMDPLLDWNKESQERALKESNARVIDRLFNKQGKDIVGDSAKNSSLVGLYLDMVGRSLAQDGAGDARRKAYPSSWYLEVEEENGTGSAGRVTLSPGASGKLRRIKGHWRRIWSLLKEYASKLRER